VKLVKFTTEIIKPMQNEIHTLQERVSKNEKELSVLKQFEKTQ
jgi:hypothetical protein